MGTVSSVHRKLALSNKEIENQIEKDRQVERRTLKLLLLGTADCGKSTILKQLRILRSSGFTETEIASFKPIVYANTLASIVAIADAMHTLSINFADPEREVDIMLVKKASSSRRMSDYSNGEFSRALVVEAIKRLWADDGVQACFQRSNEYQLNDSAKYFLDQIDRISASDYVPTQQDILCIRIETTGIVEIVFHIDDKVVRVFDVGGQRSERKKWIHCFESVSGIIFIVALSEYNQHLKEDETKNRMHESIVLFDSIVNSAYFTQTNFILFLNKKDIFAEKIKKSPITSAFPVYCGPQTFADSAAYIEQAFKAVNRTKERNIYIQQTCATDTTQTQFVLDSVLDTLLGTMMKGAGFS